MSSVSVVIPCYNYGAFLSECVRSVLDDQPGSDVRVLIIDDASSDGSAEVARQLAAADYRIDVVVHPDNRGLIATCNEGLMDWADGDYCLLISADDKLTPGALGRATQLLDEHPEVGFAYGHVLTFHQDRPAPVACTKLRGTTIWPGHSWLLHMFKVGANPIASPGVVVRTSLQHRVGPYDFRLPHTSDLEMWLRLSAYADVGYMRADQAYYRRHGSNMSSAYTASMDMRERRRAYDVLLEHVGGDLPQVGKLAEIVHRRFALEALRAAKHAYNSMRTDQMVDELETFAFECWPPAASLATYRSLQLRRRVGSDRLPYVHPLMWSAFLNDFMQWRRWRSVRRRGFWPRILP